MGPLLKQSFIFFLHFGANDRVADIILPAPPPRTAAAKSLHLLQKGPKVSAGFQSNC